MATRDENLKKINDELEKMSDEELENVAGGTYKETAADSRFLNDLAGLCDRFGSTRAFFDTNKVAEEAKSGWGKVGIEFYFRPGVGNKYYLDGKRISRNEAIRYACNKVGKNLQELNPGDYNL